MSVTKIENGFQGFIGNLHEFEIEKDSVLVFQLPRATNMLSDSYLEGAMRAVKKHLPEGRVALVIGADVNIYEIPGADATVLKLKGLLPC